MTRSELEHAIRAACDVAGDTEVYVFGSQAILGQYPDAPEALRQSAEVDIALKNRTEKSDHVDGALGELSMFHETHGFYVHGLSIEAACLPAAWESRAVIVQNANTRYNKGICLEAHDLAASKLVASRDKDRQFVRVLIQEQMIDPEKLVRTIRQLPIETNEQLRLIQWVKLTEADVKIDSNPPAV